MTSSDLRLRAAYAVDASQKTLIEKKKDGLRRLIGLLRGLRLLRGRLPRLLRLRHED